MAKNAVITGWGCYVPSRVLTNADLERIVDTSDEWITSRTGIKERRIASDEETTSFMSARAGRAALEKAHLRAQDVQLVIVGTCSPDYLFPATACLVQTELGATRAGAFDVEAACTSFITALAIARGMIVSGAVQNALVIGAEILTRYVDYTDRSTCVLFGDGAGAAVLGPVGANRGILAARIRSDGRYEEQLYAPGGGTKGGFSAETIARGDHFFKMKGNEVFKVAIRSMTDIAIEVLDEAGLKTDDVNLFIPHQANQRITDAVASKLKVDSSKVYSNIAMHGNTSSASIPIGLDECVESGRITTGDVILMASFGGGITWGGVVMRW